MFLLPVTLESFILVNCVAISTIPDSCSFVANAVTLQKFPSSHIQDLVRHSRPLGLKPTAPQKLESQALLLRPSRSQLLCLSVIFDNGLYLELFDILNLHRRTSRVSFSSQAHP
ncbi:hypothetical protein R3P38DRAFT_1585971 [Favolaschia claudopus]|uniref:Uncharacterized protein n=1 Tax=Favolaschia claudopus TaxID=2862362 RepID=A0AAW0AHK7_9AGAR